MGVSKNRGTSKWMVYNGKPYSIEMFWGYPYFWKHPYNSNRTSFSPSGVAFEMCVSQLVVVGFGQQHWIEPTLTKNYSPEN